MKLAVVIRPTETQTIEVEGESFEAARAKIDAAVPEGWQALSVRAIRD